MGPDRISNPGPLALESDGLQTVLRGPAMIMKSCLRGTPFTFEKIFASAGDRTRNRQISRPALNLLSYRGSLPTDVTINAQMKNKLFIIT